ncbi:hypothetical protein YC2023_066497 [Brassica napus]
MSIEKKAMQRIEKEFKDMTSKDSLYIIGSICLDILKDKCTPPLMVEKNSSFITSPFFRRRVTYVNETKVEGLFHRIFS